MCVLKKIALGKDAITTDNLAYRLDGKVEPRLFNLGDGEVRIEGILLKKNEAFDAGFTGAISLGSLQIEFTDPAALKNRVVCFYGTEVTDKC